MNYTQKEANVVIADSFRELNYKQKKCLLAAVNPDGGERKKYEDILINFFGEGVYNKLKARFFDSEYREKVLENLQKRKIECITVKSADYPESLFNIPTPPLVLYLRGNAELLKERKFAIVGSRRTTAPVLAECGQISSRIAEKMTVVTGVADGADGAAAYGALKSGKIICVLPGGHDGACASDEALLRRVEERGLSISEFPPTTRAQRYTFILRNRIIAGLSCGVLVVSAAEKSGAISTANYAADYGKDVFAFPYGLNVASGKGCNKLIKNGAYLCESEKDIFAVLGIECGEKEESPLEGDEKAIVDILREQGELHAEKIAQALGKKLFEVTAICSSLEIKGFIVRVGGNRFALI